MHDSAPLITPDDPVFDAADGDPTVSPADDFYRFVNGGWIDRNPVPPEYGAWGAFQEVHERNQGILRELLEEAAGQADPDPRSPAAKVGTYYRSGMDTHTIEDLGLQPIADWLDRIDALASIEDMRQLVIDLHGIGLGVPFGVGVSPDFEDATANLLYIGQAGLGLPDRDYYLRDDDTSQQLLTDYRQHVATMFALLTDDGEGADAAADAVIAIETAIAELSYTNVQMRDIDLITNKYAMSEARTLMPSFDMGAYLAGIGAGDEHAINIDNEALYPALDDLMTSVDLDDWRHYFRWHLVRSVASSLPEEFEQASFEFYGRKLGGQQEQKERWKRVLAAGTADIGHLISQMYVVDNFTPEAKARMEVLVEHLFVAMRETLTSITWMSETTKERALEKLDGFGYKIGYPDEWRNYDDLELEDGAWLANRLAARSFEVRRQLGLLGRPVDPHEWSMAPHVVNAYYHPLRNEIVFPAGILQPPFFSMDADDAVNYGAIGAVIGHEITHGFDDKGSMFDADGNVRNWWTEADRSEFDRRAAVMVEQFSAFEVADGLRVNGELTLGENIADLGGLRIALAALESILDAGDPMVGGLTPQQRFFMSWARVWRRTYTDEYLRLIVNSDPHAPSDLRCNAPISNLPSFAAAFGLAPDHPSMRPEDLRVDIW
jgi:putative endopeptidase